MRSNFEESTYVPWWEPVGSTAWQRWVVSVMGYAVASLLDQFFSELRKEPGSVNESGFIAQRSEFVVGSI